MHKGMKNDGNENIWINISSLLRLIKKKREKTQLPILRGEDETWLQILYKN